MGEKKLPIYLTVEKLKEEFGICWSKDTLKRRIQSGFPAIKDDGGRLLFETQKVREYFKKREIS